MDTDLSDATTGVKSIHRSTRFSRRKIKELWRLCI